MRVEVDHGSVESILVSAGEKFENARLLLQGEAGVRKLVQKARNRDPQVRRAALITLLEGAEARFLPLLLETWEEPDLQAIGRKAVQRFPSEAWPILRQMARQGRSGAVRGIAMYLDGRKPALEELIRDRHPLVRAEALAALNSKERLREALTDSNRRVVEVAVTGLFSYAYDDPGLRQELYFHPSAVVRGVAAEHAQTWAVKDNAVWVRLANDPSAEVRRWAMLQLGTLGMDWGAKGHVSEGIQAVGAGIAKGPAPVRRTAILATRAWTLEWEKIHTIWSAAQIDAAKNVFKMPVYRDALYAEALREPKQMEVFYDRNLHVPPAIKALAIAGDPRAFGILTRWIDSDRELYDVDRAIRYLRYTSSRISWRYLARLVGRVARTRTLRKEDGNDYHAEQALGHALATMALIDPKGDLGFVFRLATDKKIDARLRQALLQPLSNFQSEPVLQFLTKMANDRTESTVFRSYALFGLEKLADPRSAEVLRRLAEEDPDSTFRSFANGSLIRKREAAVKRR
jgi:hypothetical protein